METLTHEFMAGPWLPLSIPEAPSCVRAQIWGIYPPDSLAATSIWYYEHPPQKNKSRDTVGFGMLVLK